MYPSKLVTEYVEFIVDLARNGKFETYYCNKCIDTLDFSTDQKPGNAALIDTAFCSECHQCQPVSNPYINRYISQLGNKLVEPSDSLERHRSDFRLIHFDLHGRGYQTDAWLQARANNVSYTLAFQQNLLNRITPYWRKPDFGTGNFIPGELERANLQADFVISTMKRIYGPDLLPIAPAPDYLLTHPVNEEVMEFAQFLIELAKKVVWEDFYCERCQLDYLRIDVKYVPFSDRTSDFLYLKDVSCCCHCKKGMDVSNPAINQYFIDRKLPISYPCRSEANSNAYLIRDVLINWPTRWRSSREAEFSDLPIYQGLSKDEIYRTNYQSQMKNRFKHFNYRNLTPPHIQLFQSTYYSILGQELKPISPRIIFNSFVMGPEPISVLPHYESTKPYEVLKKFVRRFF